MASNETKGLRRNKAILSSLGDEATTQFIVARRALPKNGLRDSPNVHICEVSLPRETGPGPDIEQADSEEAEEKNVIIKTVASIPIEDSEMVYCHLFQLNTCYQAMAKNNKMVVFSDDMNIRKAFYALIYNSCRTGLVMDTKTFCITGVLSATDFIMVLMKLWKFREAITNITGIKMTEEDKARTDITAMPIRTWKDHLKTDGKLKPFQTIDVEDSLYSAAERLASSRIHRLPVMDEHSGDCMFIITHRRLLHFIWQHAALLPKPEFLRERVRDIGVGTWSNIKYVLHETPLIDALDMLMNEGISGVPVVKDDDGLEVISVYTRFDAISVAFSTDQENLSINVGEAIGQRRRLTGRMDTVVTVPQDINMWSLLETFVEKNVYRVFAVDEGSKLKGLISLSDLINFMVLRPKTIAL
ncbi:hypothetical protein PFISCL1PPCAC_26486 [Pristionchus fissidentatus]|uniref:CBS domain-containing protein n=1 Tax=Pristionchus fissidentatus TaxID=1538716 RepID=A0AAV5WX04_9BILA|nr:hypothetical protein PFISCL1PPCAC_26486 [Pristionchus fissidentatus]